MFHATIIKVFTVGYVKSHCITPSHNKNLNVLEKTVGYNVIIICPVGPALIIFDPLFKVSTAEVKLTNFLRTTQFTVGYLADHLRPLFTVGYLSDHLRPLFTVGYLSDHLRPLFKDIFPDSK